MNRWCSLRLQGHILHFLQIHSSKSYPGVSIRTPNQPSPPNKAVPLPGRKPRSQDPGHQAIGGDEPGRPTEDPAVALSTSKNPAKQKLHGGPAESLTEPRKRGRTGKEQRNKRRWWENGQDSDIAYFAGRGAVSKHGDWKGAKRRKHKTVMGK